MSALAPRRSRLQSLVDVLVRGCERNPDGPAVREGRREVSYRELDAVASRLATMLADLGVEAGQRVAVWLPKSVEAIAAMQAALRIGAMYVPIDPLSPAERVRRIFGDCEPMVCVTLTANIEATFDGELSELSLLTVSEPGGRWEPRPARASSHPQGASPRPRGGGSTEHLPSPGGEAPAYILYTSGSTGVPKGVCISHRNALAFIEWAHAELAPQSGDRFASHAPFHFDLSVLDLYVAFFAGACVCLVPEAISFAPTKLVDFVCRERITNWYSVPSALVLMERAGLLEVPPPDLRAVLFAGESFPIEPLRRLRRALPNARLLNLYGPTETNVCTFHEVGEIDEDAVQPVPIGCACSGDTVWIEENGHRLPVGARGELMVEGPTVMLGYWGASPQRGPYRTGDIVERISEDTYRYIGRRDAMVKVRGHRIELGEVEATVASHEDILEAAVVVLGDGLDSRLVAAVVASQGGTPDLLEVKRWCATRLPRHMIVHGLHVLTELPRTRNGKVDRREIVERLQAEGASR